MGSQNENWPSFWKQMLFDLLLMSSCKITKITLICLRSSPLSQLQLFVLSLASSWENGMGGLNENWHTLWKESFSSLLLISSLCKITRLQLFFYRSLLLKKMTWIAQNRWPKWKLTNVLKIKIFGLLFMSSPYKTKIALIFLYVLFSSFSAATFFLRSLLLQKIAWIAQNGWSKWQLTYIF